MSDRDFTVQDPIYASEVHPEVARECLAAWKDGKAWTQIRVLEQGTDNPSGHSCANSQGKFNTPCGKKIEAVQYNSAFGEPQFYCEEHALEQNEWDKIFYRGPKVIYEDSGMNEGETVGEYIERGKPKKSRELEPEDEYDPS